MKLIDTAVKKVGKIVVQFLALSCLLLQIAIFPGCITNKNLAQVYFWTNNKDSLVYDLYIDSVYKGPLPYLTHQESTTQAILVKQAFSSTLKSGQYHIVAKDKKGNPVISEVLILKTGKPEMMSFPSSDLCAIEVVLGK